MSVEFSKSEYQIRGNKYTVKDAAKITESQIARDINEAEIARRNRERIEREGTSKFHVNLGSDDRFSGKPYNNIGANENEMKSYHRGYFVNGEKRISAMLDKKTSEECQKYGAFEYSLGVPIENLGLLKNNTNYMAGYTMAIIMDNGEKSTKHR